MNDGGRHGASARRYWLPQVVGLAVLALLGTVPFWLTDLDLRAQVPFYRGGLDEPWFGASEPLWFFLYQAAPMITGLVVLGGLLVIAAGQHWGRIRRLRVHAVFIMTVAILGPGLIVNGVLKEQIGRPRPHQVEAFGGTKAYLPPLKVGERGGGMSFPSGHASVGFMLTAFFLIWLRSCPLRAWSALLGSVAFGGLLGLGRMAAGDHFLSDVIWSAVIVYGIAVVLYYFVFRIPQRESSASDAERSPPVLNHPVLMGVGYTVVAAVLLVGVLLATPVHQNRDTFVRAGDYDPMPRTLRLVADTADVIVYWHDPDKPLAHIKLRARGFGFPGNRVEPTLSLEDGVLNYEIAHSGMYTEKDTQLVVPVVYSEWDRIIVRTGFGDIQYAVNHRELPEFDLQTAGGDIKEWGSRPQ